MASCLLRPVLAVTAVSMASAFSHLALRDALTRTSLAVLLPHVVISSLSRVSLC